MSKTRKKDELSNLALFMLFTDNTQLLAVVCYKVFIRNNTDNKSLSILSPVYFDTFLAFILLR